MYAWRVVLACAIIISAGLERLVCCHQNVRLNKKSTSRNIYKDTKNLEWNNNEGLNGQSKPLQPLHGKAPRGELGFGVIHNHHHYYLNPNDLDNELGQEEKLNSADRRHKRFKSVAIKKDDVRPFMRQRRTKRPMGTTERRDEVKNGNGKIIQEIFPTYKTDKRFMVVSGPKTDPSAKRKRFHFSNELVNALKLVLDKRNSFKKDANILDLAKALQSRDQESNRFKNNSITTGVSHGFTQNGQRVRLVRVQDPGYNEKNDHRLGSKNSVHRSKILQDLKHSHSALVNPTELGASILKLLFGKKARYVTKPKYRHLVGAARPNMKYLEGYGSKEERAELQKEIENENQLIVLKGVKKHELEKNLAKSISNLIRAMNKDKTRKAEPELAEKNSQTNVVIPQKNGGKKTSNTQDRMGTRKSWVLLKMPKNNGEVEQDKVTQFHEPEVENDPSKVSTHQIATLGKKNNELSDVKVIHQHKHHVESSYDDIVSDDAKKPSHVAKYTHTDTESRAVPQISYNLNGLKNHRDAQKLSGTDSNGLAMTLGKILKGIQESVKELKDQNQRKEESSENSAMIKMTSPASKTSSHDSTTETSSLANSNSVAKIQDLMVAVNKLLGSDSRSSEMPSQSGMTGIPSDQASVQNVPTVDNSDATGARRFVDGASRDPFQLRPSIGYFDEPITTSVTSRKVVGEDKSLDNVLFESDELATQRDRQASIDAIKLKEDLESFAERGLNTHNKYRELHHAQKLKWSDDLATQAEKMAYDMAMKGTIEKSAVASALGYGENVAKITGTTFNKAGEEATNLWYAEIANYSFSDPRLSPETDSFTQVVWKSTLKLGMGCARDLQTNDLYVVALYDPKGNDPVGLRSNVLNKGGVTEDVYASIFKRHRLQQKDYTK